MQQGDDVIYDAMNLNAKRRKNYLKQLKQQMAADGIEVEYNVMLVVADFDNLDVDEYGRKICPSGDYINIKDFVEYCVFGGYCLFGVHCRFIGHCRFGEGCYFGDGCSFGDWCTFGEQCTFAEGCNYENDKVKNGRYVAVDRIGSANQKAYFYIDENGNIDEA